MKIIIHDARRIVDIQEEFNTVFPYLKLEFFSQGHTISEGSAKKHIINTNETLGKYRSKHNPGEVGIVPEMKVMDIEQLFSDIYGLNVQVFRKSGKVWLETTVTDGWTLEKQNARGADLRRAAE